MHNHLTSPAQINDQTTPQPMHDVLAVSALINMEIQTTWLNQAVTRILSSQAADGSWPSAPYYYGGPQKCVSWGNQELTTDLCIEALHRAHKTNSVN